MKYAIGDDEELVLHVAYRACPCGCGFDADAWIDDCTGDVEFHEIRHNALPEARAFPRSVVPQNHARIST